MIMKLYGCGREAMRDGILLFPSISAVSSPKGRQNDKTQRDNIKHRWHPVSNIFASPITPTVAEAVEL
jgi:hypothetical protein